MREPLREELMRRIESDFEKARSMAGTANARAVSIPHGLIKTWAVVYTTVGATILLAMSLHAAVRPQDTWQRVTVRNHFSFPLRVEIGDYIAPNVPPGVKVGFVPPPGTSLLVRAYRPETGKLVYMFDFGNPSLKDRLDIEIP